MGPRQVVVLGAGMDSRPWRLKLPAGLAWFEVDQAPVLAAKQRALQQAGAQISADDARAAGAHPLRAASWTAVAADLGGDGWVAALAAAGLDPSRPVVWCAEGLLMYITEDRVRSLLAAAAGSCAPGSAFVAHSLTDGFVARLRAGERPGAGATPYPCTLQDAWISGLPDDPSAALREAGWGLELVTTRAAIGREICGGADAAQALCDFDTAPGCTADGEIRFWVAKK
jgi:methyltransferase (TIGR00027 family)